ncbi:SusC/RagA family TonB-linked outer membrane protein [Hymenobacter sp. BT770]|uniref:SusC/RagA family TonB-linked outer membrane protein n=1 Tax=Hymenobacter sp. BT770 TaxID=2886942 RepID=UPI001D115E37|nr:SusC/RagA family TonB-linked outer membrane protein [Hymenobacter sp. BT770]MCC3153759.1 SusC/RagA family TonB-linked outer membrane protein [Hymenobacter sp. BT770]MDO3416893.1 SusC/RagA family TonB-linked outer membrane protein [Hymenobacter sp. BT770]
MKKMLLLGLFILLNALQVAWAQNRQITGRVTDKQTSEGLPGVTVLLKGSTVGTSTGPDGSFTLSVPASGGTLSFSSIGYATVEQPIGTDNTYNVALASDVKQLNEVVVTALGIERDVRSVNTTQQQVKGEDLAQKSEPNVLNTLQGRVSGVNITSASGLPGSSTNINIRGITSLQGNNQPLFIVDGIPISNSLDVTNGTTLGTLGAAQSSNRALDIDPNNVESISILKGPAAAALYGSRAASGAVIITTKSGRNVNKKLEVTVTSDYSIQKVYGLQDFQNDYGQGTGGVLITTGGNINTGSQASWGPRFGTPATAANGIGVLKLPDGTPVEYKAYPNNIKNFFRTGHILSNGANIAGGNKDQNFSLNINNTNQVGITEFANLKRTNVQLGGNTTLINKLKAGGSVNMVLSNQLGAPVGNGSSAFGQLPSVPRSYDLQGFPNTDPVTGRSVFFGGSDNPYWNLRNNPTTSDLTRFINVGNLSYDVAPWLNVAYRLGYDTYTDRRKQIYSVGAARVPSGQILDQNIFRSELNGDLLVTLKRDNVLRPGLNATLLLGQNVNQRRFQSISSQADNVLVPGFTNASVGGVFSNGTGERSEVRRLLGYYSQLSLAFNDYLFVDVTGRIDQTSTLPKNKNSYFFPSATLGLVFTDALKLNSSILSYGKIRGNVARVGRDADPYSLTTPYSVIVQGNNVAGLTFPLNGGGGFRISQTLGNPNLEPEFTKSVEAGLNLGFFQNRLTFDLTAYKTVSSNQIVPITTPGSTGFTQRYANVGRLDNKGIEGLMTVTPVRTDNFRWDITANYTANRNKVVSIAEGVERARITGSGFIGSLPFIVVGQPYGVIVGGKKSRSPDGQYIIDPRTGVFEADIPNSIIANPNQRWQGGLTNNLTYRGINLSFVVDTRQGGDILSFTNGFYRSNGALEETGHDRELPRVIPGVIRNSDGTFRPNNIEVDAQTYWAAFGLQSDLNVYDATVYRLREVSVGYTVPKTALGNLPFGQVNFSLSGRNLFFYAPNANFDPELNTQGAGNIRGLDLQGPPNARTYGANIRFTF